MENPTDKNTQIFLYLVSTFEMAALQQMGKIKNPMTDKIEKDLFQAQFSIDVLDMLSVKMKGNLSEYEEKFLKNIISQIKLNYVDEANKSKNDDKDKSSDEYKDEKKD
jgi:hypothetical protein